MDAVVAVVEVCGKQQNFMRQNENIGQYVANVAYNFFVGFSTA